jgi:hypothetical protein
MRRAMFPMSLVYTLPVVSESLRFEKTRRVRYETFGIFLSIPINRTNLAVRLRSLPSSLALDSLYPGNQTSVFLR